MKTRMKLRCNPNDAKVWAGVLLGGAGFFISSGPEGALFWLAFWLIVAGVLGGAEPVEKGGHKWE